MKKKIIHILILWLVASISTTSALAASNIDARSDSVSILRASRYINTCETIITANSGGTITMNSAITGTGLMATIGVQTLDIQRYMSGSWVTVKSWSSLYQYNSVQASASVTYVGVVGRQYRAVTTFYVANSTGSDSRMMTTSSVTAKS